MKNESWKYSGLIIFHLYYSNLECWKQGIFALVTFTNKKNEYLDLDKKVLQYKKIEYDSHC